MAESSRRAARAARQKPPRERVVPRRGRRSPAGPAGRSRVAGHRHDAVGIAASGRPRAGSAWSCAGSPRSSRPGGRVEVLVSVTSADAYRRVWPRSTATPRRGSRAPGPASGFALVSMRRRPPTTFAARDRRGRAGSAIGRSGGSSWPDGSLTPDLQAFRMVRTTRHRSADTHPAGSPRPRTRWQDGRHYRLTQRPQRTGSGPAASGGHANVAKVTMPQLGESVAEGTIGKWLKQPGDHVDKYEPLVEVITDKVNAEVPSPFEGILREILAEEGATVPNNAEIAVIETADDGGQARRRTPSGRLPQRQRRRPAPGADGRSPPARPRRAAPAADRRRRPRTGRLGRAPRRRRGRHGRRRRRQRRSRRAHDARGSPAPPRARAVGRPRWSARAAAAGSPARTCSGSSRRSAPAGGGAGRGTPAPAAPAPATAAPAPAQPRPAPAAPATAGTPVGLPRRCRRGPRCR